MAILSENIIDFSLFLSRALFCRTFSLHTADFFMDNCEIIIPVPISTPHKVCNAMANLDYYSNTLHISQQKVDHILIRESQVLKI